MALCLGQETVMPTAHEDPERLSRARRRHRQPGTAQPPRGTLLRRMQRHMSRRCVRAAYRGGRGGYVPICIKLMGIRDGNLGISEVLLIMRISRTMCLAQSTS